MTDVAEFIEKLHSLCILSLLVLLGNELNRIDAAMDGIAILDEVVEVVEGGFVMAKN